MEISYFMALCSITTYLILRGVLEVAHDDTLTIITSIRKDLTTTTKLNHKSSLIYYAVWFKCCSEKDFDLNNLLALQKVMTTHS